MLALEQEVTVTGVADALHLNPRVNAVFEGELDGDLAIHRAVNVLDAGWAVHNDRAVVPDHSRRDRKIEVRAVGVEFGIIDLWGDGKVHGTFFHLLENSVLLFGHRRDAGSYFRCLHQNTELVQILGDLGEVTAAVYELELILIERIEP